MQEKHLFEYAIIRVVPRVERGEFLNVGVIVYCPSKRFLCSRHVLDGTKLYQLDPEIDLETLKKYLQVFELVCKGGPEGGRIGQMSISERFHWLTATRSTIIQTSPVHLGLAADPDEALNRLFDQQVSKSMQ
jgi:hypothetical protein